MSGKPAEDVGLYCSVVCETIVWSVEQEVIDLCGAPGYACYSMCCSKYVEDGCGYYGISSECKSIMKQARKIAKDNLIF